MQLTESLTDLCYRELELCALREGESLAVLSHGQIRQNYAEAFLAAAARLGADAYQVRLAEGTTAASGEAGTWMLGATPISGHDAVVESLKAADMVVDLITLLFSPEQHEILSSGTRMLMCIEPVDNLARMFPTPGLRERVEAGGEMMAKADTLRFTNEAGSDCTFTLSRKRAHMQYGYTDTPGRWDHWPSAMVATYAADDGVDGKVVVAPGDILLPFKHFVTSSIEFTIEHGRIVDVRGGFDADLVNDYMEAYDDPDANGISHIGWGMLESARWSGLGLDTRSMHMESRSFPGNVLFSTGPNVSFGGPNSSLCHIDIPMRNCDLFLDDEPIVLGGEIAVPELKAPKFALV